MEKQYPEPARANVNNANIKNKKSEAITTSLAI